MAGMVGWPGDFEDGKRPAGIHPWALIGAPPEHRDWKVGDPYVAPHIGHGVLIDAFCTVDAGMVGPPYTTTVGNWSWLQKRVHVGHNAKIGVNCEICVGTTICGEVVVGHGVKIGGNTWVKPRVRIGDGAVIGGGSVVTKDVPAHEVWAGNPARFMKLAWTHPEYGKDVRCVCSRNCWETTGLPLPSCPRVSEPRDDAALMDEGPFETMEAAVNAARGLAGRERALAQYDMTADQWEAARAAVGYPSQAELDEWQREAARSGAFQGHGVDGDAA